MIIGDLLRSNIAYFETSNSQLTAKKKIANRFQGRPIGKGTSCRGVDLVPDPCGPVRKPRKDVRCPWRVSWGGEPREALERAWGVSQYGSRDAPDMSHTKGVDYVDWRLL